MRWSITKRIGLRTEPARIRKSTKLTWLQTITAPPGLGHVLVTAQRQAVHRARQDPGDEAQQELGQQRVDVDRDRGVEPGDDQEHHRHRQPAASAPHGEQQRADTINSAFRDVVAGDHARALGRLGALLDQRVERHGVEAAEQRDREQVAQDARRVRARRRTRRSRAAACPRRDAGAPTKNRSSVNRSCRSSRAAPGRARGSCRRSSRRAATRARCRRRTPTETA